MKKYIFAAAALAMLAIFGLAQSQSQAHKVVEHAPDTAVKGVKKAETVTGIISAIDPVKSEIIILDGKDAERELGVEKAKIAVLKVGDNVIGKVVDNKAKNLKVIKKHGAVRP